MRKELRKELLFTFDTDIILVVRVPVLSLHITVVHPKVSTDGKDLTIAFKRAILLVPRAKQLLRLEEKKNDRNTQYIKHYKIMIMKNHHREKVEQIKHCVLSSDMNADY